MHLSVSQAAVVLDKTPRQVRYMIRQEQLSAVRQGKSWRIDSASLPLSDEAKQALLERVGEARETFEAALAPAAQAVADISGQEAPPADEPKTERYSVRKLLAFQAAEQVYGEMQGEATEVLEARHVLFQAVVQLTQGCHAFRSEEKATHFRSARSLAAESAARLYLSRASSAADWAHQLEQEVIPKIGGLVAAHEKRRRRNRFQALRPQEKRNSS